MRNTSCVLLSFRRLVALVAIFAIAIMSSGVHAQDAAQKAIQHIKSNHSVQTTIERAERIASYHGLRVLGIIDYAEISTEWLPKGKTPVPARLMVFVDNRGAVPRALQENTLLALELPLKILVWEDRNGGVWVSYRNLQASALNYQPAVSPQLLSKLDSLVRTLGDEAAN